MGNRAVIVVQGSTDVGIYLHWSGGPESVLAFLEAAKQLGTRDPVVDPDYFRARFVQIVANYFGGTTSIGVGLASRLDDSDNGTYTVGERFVIDKRDPPGPQTLGGLGVLREYYEGILNECLEKNGALFAAR